MGYSLGAEHVKQFDFFLLQGEFVELFIKVVNMSLVWQTCG